MSLLQFTLGWRCRSWRASSLPAHKVVVARLELQVLARIRVVSGGSGFEPAGPRSISCWSNSGRARRFPAVSGGFRRFPAVLVLNRPVTDLFHCGPSRVPPGGFRRFPAVFSGSGVEQCRHQIRLAVVQNCPTRRFPAVSGGLGLVQILKFVIGFSLVL